MMHQNPVLCVLIKLSWLITALVALHIGLVEIGFDVTGMPFYASIFAPYAMWLRYLVGIAGAISLSVLVGSFLGYDCCHHMGKK